MREWTRCEPFVLREKYDFGEPGSNGARTIEKSVRVSAAVRGLLMIESSLVRNCGFRPIRLKN
jgi:hypothetical protein